MDVETGSKITTDHEEIKTWVEERDGKPGVMRTTEHSEQPPALVIDFPGHTGEESVEEITWEEFFGRFESEGLAFVYKDDTAGGERSTFSKIVTREKAQELEGA